MATSPTTDPTLLAMAIYVRKGCTPGCCRCTSVGQQALRASLNHGFAAKADDGQISGSSEIVHDLCTIRRRLFAPIRRPRGLRLSTRTPSRGHFAASSSCQNMSTGCLPERREDADQSGPTTIFAHFWTVWTRQNPQQGLLSLQGTSASDPVDHGEDCSGRVLGEGRKR